MRFPNILVADAVLLVPIVLALALAIHLHHPQPRYAYPRGIAWVKVSIIGGLVAVACVMLVVLHR